MCEFLYTGNSPNRRKRCLFILTVLITLLFTLSSGLSEERHTDLRFHESFHSPLRLSAGKFLVANRNLKDPRFYQSVILLVSYDRSGALGVVLNRPTVVKLSDALPEVKELDDRNDILYYGGPVSVDQIGILYRSRIMHEHSIKVIDDVFFSFSQNVFQLLMTEFRDETMFRAYAGYTGWSSGQLDSEIVRGDWYILDADSDIVFYEDSSEIWHELMRRISLKLWVGISGQSGKHLLEEFPASNRALPRNGKKYPAV